MPYVLDLPKALKAEGLDVEVVPGWQTRGSASFNPGGAVCHWTAGPKTGDRPSLKVCIDGREGLDGPLCNVFLPRGLTAAAKKVVVVAAGRANHAGKGGWKGLVGNSSVFGTEAENSGGGEWTAFQRWAYPRINVAYARLGGFGSEMVCGHNEWAPTRKIDIRDWPMSSMRASVKTLLTTKEDDMPLTDAEIDKIALRVWRYSNPNNADSRDAYGDLRALTSLRIPNPKNPDEKLTPADWAVWGNLAAQAARDAAASAHAATTQLSTKVDALQKAVGQLAAGQKVDVDVDEAELARELAPILAPVVLEALAGKGLTREDVEDAIWDVVENLKRPA